MRSGLTVEFGNTDAEGRLVLADAITLSGESKCDLLIYFSTLLTGAARVALGPDLPAMFSNDLFESDAVLRQGELNFDPLWPMPLYEPYNEFIKSSIADTNSCSKGGYGGPITAALFLQKFVPKETAWCHIDLMAANTRSMPGRPVGGEAMGLRALFAYLSAWAKSKQ